jgi:hypothetical protein
VALHRAAHVVDHHGRTSTSQVPGVQSAEPTTGAGNDHNLPGKVDHLMTLLFWDWLGPNIWYRP